MGALCELVSGKRNLCHVSLLEGLVHNELTGWAMKVQLTLGMACRESTELSWPNPSIHFEPNLLKLKSRWTVGSILWRLQDYSLLVLSRIQNEERIHKFPRIEELSLQIEIFCHLITPSFLSKVTYVIMNKDHVVILLTVLSSSPKTVSYHLLILGWRWRHSGLLWWLGFFVLKSESRLRNEESREHICLLPSNSTAAETQVRFPLKLLTVRKEVVFRPKTLCSVLGYRDHSSCQSHITKRSVSFDDKTWQVS